MGVELLYCCVSAADLGNNVVAIIMKGEDERERGRTFSDMVHAKLVGFQERHPVGLSGQEVD